MKGGDGEGCTKRQQIKSKKERKKEEENPEKISKSNQSFKEFSWTYIDIAIDIDE